MQSMQHSRQPKRTTQSESTARASESAVRPGSATRVPIWAKAVTLQPKRLRVNQPNDAYEREADRAADHVMRMPEASVQRQPDEEEEEMLQPKRLPAGGNFRVQRQVEDEEEEELLQPSRAPGAKTPTTAPPSVSAALRSPGQPLDGRTRSFMEPRFGYDFGDVRVHTDATAAHSAADIQAIAYTVGTDIVFGTGQYNPGTVQGRQLLAHELTHVLQQGQGNSEATRNRTDEVRQSYAAQNNRQRSSDPEYRDKSDEIRNILSRPATQHVIQRAEVDDNPKFCFPPDGTPLRDSKDIINGWIASAAATASKNASHITAAIYSDLGTGTGVTKVEKKLGSLPMTYVRHVKMSESRYAGTGLWPVDPLTKLALQAAGKIFVAPVINLCGVCVGTDKVGHFFQQGYEYFRLGQEIRAYVQGMSLDEKKQFLKRLQGPLPVLDIPFETPADDLGTTASFEFSESAYTDLIANAFVEEFGLWLEGFNHRLRKTDIRWIKTRKFIPWYYSEGVYGQASTGVLSRADLQANRQGYQFYRDLWLNPKKKADISDYVGELRNEYKELSTPTEALGTPQGKVSHSMDITP